jgi:hypothetical protein
LREVVDAATVTLPQRPALPQQRRPAQAKREAGRAGGASSCTWPGQPECQPLATTKDPGREEEKVASSAQYSRSVGLAHCIILSRVNQNSSNFD